uniref:Diagnostic antigen gp50 n=1 Tax=Echinococcus granulosus TaxID=6210 RepID=A0A068WMI1_ECHGR|nr:diagnostic antigen gp50 [Echinococcus granulosus]
MLTSTFCLVILLVNFALGDPELLGSRVITQPIGKSSPPMYFLYNVGSPQGTLRSSGGKVGFVIANGACKLTDGTVIGSPCFRDNAKSQVTLYDVGLFYEIILVSRTVIYTVFFVILIKYSWPLSRFRKNKTTVYVEFGLREDALPLSAQIIYDSQIVCLWKNGNLAISNFDNCSWETNYSEGCKIFRGHFHRLRNI